MPKQRLVALVVGVGDEGDAGGDQLGPGGVDDERVAAVPGERDPVVGAGLLPVLELGLGDRHLEADVPERRGLGLVGLAPGQVAQEGPLAGAPGCGR